MHADEYQAATNKTAFYKEAGSGSNLAIFYCALGLGEAGEVQGKVKKWLRDDVPFDIMREQVKKELGDVQWYIARLCYELNIPLSEVMTTNLHKLDDRKERGVLGGSGDMR